MDCRICKDAGYVTSAGTEFALAEPCACRQPCPSCGGTGILLEDDEDGPPTMSRCRCRELSRRTDLFTGAGIPAAMHDRTLESYRIGRKSSRNQVNAWNFLKSYRRSFHPPDTKGFLLFGPSGTGKTHLMCALLSHFALEMGIEVKFIDFFHLLSMLRTAYSEKTSEEEILGPLVEVEVLAIDELGKGRATDWEVSVVDQLISRRYNTGRTVLATTNYHVGDTSKASKAARTTLNDRVGERVFSRLVEMCQIMEVDGPDYRKRNGGV